MKSLAYGLGGLIPDSAPAAFGARAILKCGVIDFVPDRKDVFFSSEKDKKSFVKWSEKVGMKWLAKTAKNLWGNKAELMELDDGVFHVRCNTNASYGYLYITMWMDATPI